MAKKRPAWAEKVAKLTSDLASAKKRSKKDKEEDTGARLAPEDLANLNAQRSILDFERSKLVMLEGAYLDSLHRVKSKYSLPDEFKFDRTTGQVSVG